MYNVALAHLFLAGFIGALAFQNISSFIHTPSEPQLLPSDCSLQRCQSVSGWVFHLLPPRAFFQFEDLQFKNLLIGPADVCWVLLIFVCSVNKHLHGFTTLLPTQNSGEIFPECLLKFIYRWCNRWKQVAEDGFQPWGFQIMFIQPLSNLLTSWTQARVL